MRTASAIKDATNIQSIDLLKAFRGLTSKFESQRYQPMQVHEMNMKICLIKQGRHMSCSTYLITFTKQAEMMESCGGTIGYSTGVAAMNNKVNKTTQKAKEHYLATALLIGYDTTRYGKLPDKLENGFLKGDKVVYLVNNHKTYDLLLNLD